MLGFFSIVDTVDSLLAQGLTANLSLTTLDLFRFNAAFNPTTLTDFTTFPRSLVPGQAAVFDDLTHEYAFSDRNHAGRRAAGLALEGRRPDRHPHRRDGPDIGERGELPVVDRRPSLNGRHRLGRCRAGARNRRPARMWRAGDAAPARAPPLVLSEGLRPSDSPTRALARRCRRRAPVAWLARQARSHLGTSVRFMRRLL